MHNTEAEPLNFLNEIGNYIFTSKYARYDASLERRETWEETVDRVQNMHLKKFKSLPKEDRDRIKWAFSLVREKRVVPSMRSMQFAGRAVEAHNARLFNCAVRHIDSIRSFAEVFYLLLCGNGVGLGLTKKFLERLPDLVSSKDKTGTVITYVIEDTIEGWADSLEALLACYFRNTAYTGRKIVYDYSRIRPEGTPLKTGGGKAPGYKGLKKCHQKVKALLDFIIEEQNVKRIRPIHAYDILMHAADAVLSGGIRRSATSVMFDKDDLEMIVSKTNYKISKKHRFALDEDSGKYHGKVAIGDKTYDVVLTEYEYKETLCKNGEIGWWIIEPQRARSNNSVIINRNEVSFDEFLTILNRTKDYGEPGFAFVNDNRQLFNPCFEIGFIPVTEDGVCGVQFCNLTSVNGAKVKSSQNFVEAVEAASIIGTLQASYTDYYYLRPASKKLTEDEALLGVSITGIMDNPAVLLDPKCLQLGAKTAIATNKIWSKKIGINQAARVTCIKPEGTSSLVLGSASGVHAHHSKRYFRRVQANRSESVYKFFRKVNPHACEESVWSANKTDDIITFPIQINNGAMVKSDLTAIGHLDIIKSIQENWVNFGASDVNKKAISHNVSCTVMVKPEEWLDVARYIYGNKNYFAAVSLLPDHGDKLYKQAPLEAITTESDEAKWKEITSKFKSVDYTLLKEEEDNTLHVQEAACAGGNCIL